MAKFKHYDYDQTVMVPVCLTEQLMAGTLEFAIHQLVETKIDISRFNERYKNDETGCPAYDPKILLKAILFGYARGLISSRKIERACRENIIFMALCCGQCPDHTTISTFIASLQTDILPIFRDVLLACEQQGLLGGTHLALDGCKLPANASQQWSGTFEQLQHKQTHMEEKLQHLLSEHTAQDQQDETSVPQTSEPDKLTKLKRKIENLQAFLATNKPKQGSKQKENKSNLTDNDSAQMQTSHGTIQGYNAQALVDSKCQVILHADAIGNDQDHGNLPPLLDGARENLSRRL